MEEIIDGVDVSGCEHFIKYDKKKPICRSGGCQRVYKSCLCAENIDCHYRQLKRLEAENAKLKEENKALKRHKRELGNVAQRFVEDINTYLKENKKLKETTDGLLSIQYTLADNCNKYYKALEEIKKISKVAFAVCDDDCGNANKFMDIINKVSEVLKDEYN